MKTLLKNSLKRVNLQLDPLGTLPINTRQIQTVLYIGEMYNRVKVSGSVVECGVGRGRTLLYLSALAEKDGREVWGFDSFEGFPDPGIEDASERNPKRGEWKYETVEEMYRVLSVAGLTRLPRLIKGYVEDTLVQYDGSPIALLHIDLDLYSGYQATLETLVPQVVSGGLVLLDDYSPKWPGAVQAVDEYLADKPWKLQAHSSGKYYFEC